MVVKFKVHTAFQDFTDDWQKGNRPIVFSWLLGIFFMDRCDVCRFPLGRNRTRLKGKVEERAETWGDLLAAFF